MTQEYKPGQIVPQSGVYKVTHDPVHADILHEVTVIRGRRFPTCRHCKGITFELAHAAKHAARSTISRRSMPRPDNLMRLSWRPA